MTLILYDAYVDRLCRYLAQNPALVRLTGNSSEWGSRGVNVHLSTCPIQRLHTTRAPSRFLLLTLLAMQAVGFIPALGRSAQCTRILLLHRRCMPSQYFDLRALTRAISTGLHQTEARHAITNLEMPAMSPTMTEGGIASWKKKAGESFNTGDVLLEIVGLPRLLSTILTPPSFRKLTRQL